MSGLPEERLRGIVPELSKEIRISATEERSALRAGWLRFVREGLWQTFIKVVAGLIVGYLLLEFGMR